MQLDMEPVLRWSAYGRPFRYVYTNDRERLAVDPAVRQVVGGRATDRQAASISQMGWLETEILTARKNLKALTDLPEMWVDRACQRRALGELKLDVNSSGSQPYGRQEASA
jgi:hypothetical protein